MLNSKRGWRRLTSTKITLALVAQGTEQLPSKQLVVGSNPTERVEFLGLLHLEAKNRQGPLFARVLLRSCTLPH